MAEIAVNLVIDKLGPLLVREIKLLRGVRKEVEDIETELKSIRWFLKDAEAKAAAEELQGKNSNEGVQLWVEQVREVAYCIEDVIDEFAFTVAQLPHGKGLFGVLHKVNRSIKKLKLRHNIANDIKDIKSKLVKIEERRKRYGFDSIEQGSSSERRNILRQGGCGVGSYYIEEDQIVGYDSIRNEVNKQLVNSIPERRVIALVGAGGLGKTTLAASAYKNKDVRSHFICHAWIYVGRTYIKEDLLKRMIQNFDNSSKEESAPSNIEAMDEIGLIDKLRECLENKSYMVVFDDVWKDEFWADIEHALPDNNKSSRLIITARNRGVACFIPTTSVVHISKLEGLPSDEAWQLFCKKAFNGSCPPELEELSKKIIEKCRGLPLAIAAVGGLLSHKNKIVPEWKKLLHNLGSELGSDPSLASCHRVLSEGYNDLPAHLKPCLLYFGSFPESYSINRGRLIRLWIAEGFVRNQYNNCNGPEEVGQEYIAELLQRNLVHVSNRFIDGRGKAFRVHDLMHEIILKKTEQLSFSQIVSESDMNQCRKIRRLTIHKSIGNVLKRIIDSKPRTLIFSKVKLPQASISASFVGNLKLVKVLDFKGSPIADLPEGVGNLFHLHYLSLKNTKVKALPKTIGKLVNLESLNLKKTLVSELPVEIKHLKKLRYLVVTHSDRPCFSYGEGAKIQEGFGSLMDLQNLDGGLQLNSKTIKELKKLRRLRKLGIQLVNGNDMKDLWSSISNMKDLISLGIELMTGEDMLDVESMASPPICLNRLYLLANLTKLPDWIAELKNLFRLMLGRSGLVEDPMRVLHNLPNLLDLSLAEAYNGLQLLIKQGWFLKLQELDLHSLKGLEFIMIEDGAMPLLEQLTISSCPLLKEIPTGIENLRNLQGLLFQDMSKEFHFRITHETSEKLRRIPKVFVICKDEGGREIWMSVKDILDLQPKSIERIPEKEASS